MGEPHTSEEDIFSNALGSEYANFQQKISSGISCTRMSQTLGRVLYVAKYGIVKYETFHSI